MAKASLQAPEAHFANPDHLNVPTADQNGSLPAHDSIGGEREHDKIECHQNGQDLTD